MQEMVTEPWLVVDFFLRSYRVSGRVYVRHRNLADQLIDPTTAFLRVEDAYVSNVEHPAEITASHASAILGKAGISAVLVTRQEDGLPLRHAYARQMGTYMYKVLLLVPSYEIEGYLRLPSQLELRTVLATGTDNFIVILNGEMRPSIRPDISFTAGTILVNKSQVEAFWVEEGSEDGQDPDR
jgi:hypothetical protein